MARLHDQYTKVIVPKLAEKFGRTNVHSLPKLQKIVLNMGVGKALQDKNRMDQAADQLAQITGQKAQVTKAKKILTNAVIGMVIIMAAYAITGFVVGAVLTGTGVGGATPPAEGEVTPP